MTGATRQLFTAGYHPFEATFREMDPNALYRLLARANHKPSVFHTVPLRSSLIFNVFKYHPISSKGLLACANVFTEAVVFLGHGLVFRCPSHGATE